jgi:hypothetical protein
LLVGRPNDLFPVGRHVHLRCGSRVTAGANVRRSSVVACRCPRPGDTLLFDQPSRG